MKSAWERMKKAVITIACGMGMLFISCSLSVKAAETASVQIDQITVEDGKCVLYVNHDQGEAWQVQPETSTLTMDGKACVIESIDTLGNSETPVSYVCMIDVSGSMSQERIDAAKAILNQMADGKKDADNFYITKMGNQLTSSEVLQNADEIKAYIDTITVTKEDTNLYQGIKEELAAMQSQEGLHTKKCLIIFSDGADDQVTGITREEAIDAVKESNIPIFTVAMLKDNPTDDQAEAAKVLGSFARYSAGGQHFAPGIEDYGYEEVCGRIQSTLSGSLIVRATVEGLDTVKDTITVKLILSDGNTTATVEREMSGELAAGFVYADMSESELESEFSETEIIESEEGDSGLKTKQMVAIAAVVVCVFVIIVVIVFNLRKEKLASEVALVKKAEIEMRQLSGLAETYSFVIKEEIKIGRGRRCQLCLKDDAALSEIHCSMRLKQGELYVKDEDSTNGTYVNGIPIVGEYKLEQGDVLLIGSYEYKIGWKM